MKGDVERDRRVIRVERVHREAAARIRKMAPEDLKRKIRFFTGEDLRGGEILWGAIFHNIHHRGQLTTYLRPMGGKVPSIYGPSADDPGGA